MTPMEEGRIWKAIWQWGPVVVMMALIFVASATPGTELPKFGQADTLIKKGGHFLGYAILAFALMHAYSKGGDWRRAILPSFVTLVLYACSDELHQRFTPGRHPSILDVGIDSLGGLIGLSLYAASQRLRGRRSEPSLLADK